MDADRIEAVKRLKERFKRAKFGLVRYTRSIRDIVPGFDVFQVNGGIMVIYATGEPPKRDERVAHIARLEECLPLVESVLGPKWTVRLVRDTEWAPHIFAILR